MARYDEISRRQFVKIGSGVAAAGVFAGLFGCAKGSDAGSEGSSDGAATPEATTTTITDLKGDQVEVPTKINTIADLWHAHNQVVLMLGAGDKLVGTTENFKKGAWVQVVYPRINDVETLVTGSGAGEVNYEEALSLQPDVVFTSDEEVTANARKQGLTTVNVMFQDYEGLRNDVALTAQILGSEAQDIAKEWEKMLDENIDLVAKRMKDVADADKTKVLHIVNGKDYKMVDGRGTIVDEWIKLAGGVNAIEQNGNRIEITEEEIIGANPDVIIIGSGTPDQVEALKADSAWTGVKAVQDGAVYANPSGVFPWDRYSGEEALQVLWAAKALNPDTFSDIDMVKEVKKFYDLFYGFAMTDDQVQMMLSGEKPA